jgi:hypothetical protein
MSRLSADQVGLRGLFADQDDRQAGNGDPLYGLLQGVGQRRRLTLAAAMRLPA